MLQLLKSLVRRTDAQDVLEYALLAAFISIGAFGVFAALGGNVEGIYSTTQTATLSASDGTSPEAGGNPTGSPNGNPPNGNPPNGNPPNGNPPNGNPPNGNPPNGNPPNGNPPNNPPNGNPPKPPKK